MKTIAYAPQSVASSTKEVACGASCNEVVYSGITEAEFSAYQTTVTDNGMVLHTDNSVTNTTKKNYSLTYKNGFYVLTLDYNSYTQELRVTYEAANTTHLITSNDYTSIQNCTSLVTQIGLGDVKEQDPGNGMAYVIRLADCSFIVIDGGHNAAAAKLIYDVLYKQASEFGREDDIVVAAWLFTHAHDDHVGFFSSFAQNYSNVTVQQFLYNFPGEALISDMDVDALKEINSGYNNWATANEMITTITATLDQYYPSAKRINAHTGQAFDIRNATVKILYTTEALFGTSKFDTLKTDYNGIAYYNDTSMVFTIEVEGVKMIFLGDAGAITGHLLVDRYDASELKSDIIQVSHHGMGSSPHTCYDEVDADWILWPMGKGSSTSTVKYYNQLNATHNDYFFGEDASTTVTSDNHDTLLDKYNIYVARNQITVLTLSNGTVSPACVPSARPTVSEYTASE